MDSRETIFVTVTRFDDPGAKAEQVEVYVDDGTPVDPELRARHMGTPEPGAAPASEDTVTVTRAELADVIAAAAAAAVAAQRVPTATPTAVRQAAHTALTQEVP